MSQQGRDARIVEEVFRHKGKSAILLSLPRDVNVSAYIKPAKLQTMWLKEMAKIGLIVLVTIGDSHLVSLTEEGLCEVTRRTQR